MCVVSGGGVSQTRGAGPTHLNEGDHQEDEQEERCWHSVSALHQVNGV